jgi:hypothetical protein
VCKTERETVIHVLWTCLTAQDVWGGSLSNFQKCGTNYSSFLTLFEDFQVHFKKETMELMVITARRLWLRINSFIFEGVFSSPSDILAGAKVTLEEFMRFSNPDQSTSESNAEPQVQIQQACKPPPNDHIKVNWDATINKKKIALLGLVWLQEIVGGILWGHVAWYISRERKHVWLKLWLHSRQSSFARRLVSLR